VKAFLVVLAAVGVLAVPAAATAHPLGNFTTNRYGEVVVAGDRLYVHYVLDLAEIPTFQARGELRRVGRAAYGRRLLSAVARGVEVRADGRTRPLRPLGHTLSFPAGAAGLRTTRLEAVLDAGGVKRAARVAIAYVDHSFAGRLGWREVVVRASDGARLETSSVPRRSVSRRLRSYPADLLSSPLDVSRARARAVAGTRDGSPPGVAAVRAAGRSESASAIGFAGLVERDSLSAGVVLVSLLVALFWGAAHALTPGHGKAIVAAYMVGARGTARHAFLLGGVVTVTHTIGVFALGLVTLALSELVVPEQLYPWLNLGSALLVVAVGVTVLRARLLGWIRSRSSHGGHAHSHDGRHDHHHHHDHGDHAHGEEHGHSHVPPPGSGLRGLVAVGVSGGLLPCPTALVVLLAAISLHRVAYGMVLILAFSAGLAAVVTAIGLLAVGSRRLFDRVSLDGALVRALPAFSAAVIVALGVAMTLRSLPAVT
jgi:nickel/cobalt transporter (NicO) family protein